jgi:hypothetical protein
VRARGPGVWRLCHGRELTHSSCMQGHDPSGPGPRSGSAVLRGPAGLSGLVLLKILSIIRISLFANLLPRSTCLVSAGRGR